jgi:hypothetical protein
MATVDEINQVVNPKSHLMGPTGSNQLDVMMSAAEQAYQRAKFQCGQIKPLFRGDSLQHAIEQCMAIISSELGLARRFLASAEGYLKARKQRAQKDLRDNQIRPQNISDELIVSRIHSLEVLFDSMNKKDLLGRIELELKEGDDVSKYILRGGENWLPLYLESRQIPYPQLVNAILNTASVIETTLQNACSEYLTVENLLIAFEDANASIESSFQQLPLEVLSWAPKQQMSGNSLEDLPDDQVLTAGDLKRFATSGAFEISRGRW